METTTLKVCATERLPVLRMNLSFSGCGLLAIYHLGVAKMLITHGHRFMMNVQRFGGASAGSLIASILAVRGCDLKAIEDTISFAFKLARDVRHRPLGVLTPGTDLLVPVETFLTELLPENCHLIATDRLFVSITDSVTKKNMIVSTFTSKQELIQYLLASSYIPVLTGSKPVFINGRKYYDGGMTDNQPVFAGGRTVCVSPFDGGQEISPHDGHRRHRWYTSLHNQSLRVSLKNVVRCLHTFVPPSDRLLDAYKEQGMADARRFLASEGYYDR